MAFASFLISTLVYTFSREGLPGADIVQFPEAFKYLARRQNIYGYGMLAVFIIASLIIYIVSLSGINQTVIVLILWPLVALASYRLMIYHTKREGIYDLADYISMTMQERVSVDYVKWLNSIHNDKELLSPPEIFMGYNTNFLRETYRLKKVFSENTKTDISYSEIEAADPKK